MHSMYTVYMYMYTHVHTCSHKHADARTHTRTWDLHINELVLNTDFDQLLHDKGIDIVCYRTIQVLLSHCVYRQQLGVLFHLKPSSQYDARASITSRASGWRWNRLNFYSSVVSRALASVQPIRLSKNLMSEMQFDWKKTFFPWCSRRQRHIVNQALLCHLITDCLWLCLLEV